MSHLSAASFDSFVAAGNYFLLHGYPCTIGHHHVQLLDEVSTVKRQINRYNVLLTLLYENWRIPPYVVTIDSKAAVFIVQDNDLLQKVRAFPQERFAALVSAVEKIAEKVVNPERSGDLYLAPEQGSPSIATLLTEAQVHEEIIQDILPALTMHADDDVNILVRDYSGAVRPIVLPPTEAVRKPMSSTAKKEGFWAKVSDRISVYNYLVTEDGVMIDAVDGDVGDFEIGKAYFFSEVSQRTTFSKQVRHATCNMKPHGDMFLPE